MQIICSHVFGRSPLSINLAYSRHVIHVQTIRYSKYSNKESALVSKIIKERFGGENTGNQDYDTYLQSELKKGLDAGDSYFKKIPAQHLNVSLFSTMINEYASATRIDDIMNVLQQMQSLNITPNIDIMNMVMNCHLTMNRIDEGLALFKQMIDKGIRPVNSTIPLLIKMYSKKKSVEHIDRVYTELMPLYHININRTIALSMIAAYIDNNHEQKAIDLFNSLPSIVRGTNTYKLIMKLYLNRQDLQNAERVFQMTIHEGSSVDENTLSSIICNFVTRRDFVKARDIVIAVKKSGIKISFKSIIKDVLMHLCDMGEYELAMDLLLKLSVKYKYLHRKFLVLFLQAKQFGLAEEILQAVKVGGNEKTLLFIKIYIEECTSSNDTEKAVEMLEKMEKLYDIKPTISCINPILSYYVRTHEFEKALKLLNEAISVHALQPDEVTNKTLSLAKHYSGGQSFLDEIESKFRIKF